LSVCYAAFVFDVFDAFFYLNCVWLYFMFLSLVVVLIVMFGCCDLYFVCDVCRLWLFIMMVLFVMCLRDAFLFLWCLCVRCVCFV